MSDHTQHLRATGQGELAIAVQKERAGNDAEITGRTLKHST